MKTLVTVVRFALLTVVAFASFNVMAIIAEGGSSSGCQTIWNEDGGATVVCSSGGGSGFDSAAGGVGSPGTGFVAVASATGDWISLFRVDKKFCKGASETCDAEFPTPNWRSRMALTTCATYGIGVRGACNAAVTEEAKVNMCANVPSC